MSNILNDKLIEEIKIKQQEGKLPCASAFDIASRLDVLPIEVGKAVDLLNIRLNKCQLGLFGYGKNIKKIKSISDISEQIENCIHQLSKDKTISCINVWNIAQQTNSSKMHIANACESINIKIKPCQLGAF